MPFIAVCPYCRAGRVRAPESALGLTAACPSCHSCFTVVDSGETFEQAHAKSGPLARPAIAKAPTAPVPKVDRSVPIAALVRGDAPTAVAEVTAIDEDAVVPSPSRVIPFVETKAAPEPVRVPTLIAFILAGLGLVAVQLPYGRYVTIGLAGLGLLLAIVSWVAATRPLLPALATGLNTIIVLITLVLPGWLGLGPWRPTAVTDDSKTVQTFGADGLAAPPGDWITAPNAWQLGDVRVKLVAMWIGPVELTAPDGKTRWSRKRFLQIRVRLGNVGVAREIDVAGWDPNPKTGEPGVRLTDAAGRPIPSGTLESGGTVPAARPAAARLVPGRAANQLLLFEAPTRPTEYFRLELSGSTFGADQPVRFQIPSSWTGTGPPR